jgi:Rrf2 family protein
VRRVIGRLVAAGIVRTLRGAGGGVALARPAAQVSLLDVVQAMEGGVVLNRCVHTRSACPLAESCPVQATWTELTGTLEHELAAVRFDRLARGTRGHVAAHRGRHTAHVRSTDQRF